MHVLQEYFYSSCKNNIHFSSESRFLVTFAILVFFGGENLSFSYVKAKKRVFCPFVKK